MVVGLSVVTCTLCGVGVSKSIVDSRKLLPVEGGWAFKSERNLGLKQHFYRRMVRRTLQEKMERFQERLRGGLFN